ncbi:venom allergen 5-like [Lycorma delicatula]|uniref:venom allergen 5-like n=1 Tax=Lycorma delicatula TaxID=130591 RepID=UPI003F514FA6
MYSPLLYILLLLCFTGLRCLGSIDFQFPDGYLILSYSGVTGDEKNEILKFHNQIRAQTATGENNGQPPGKNIRKMVWNDNLENLAQKWANVAPNGINPNLGKFGQNVDISTEWIYPEDKKNLVQYCMTWFELKKNYKYTPMNSDIVMSSQPVTHYTQMVAADSYEIGCGFAVFHLTHVKNIAKIYFICNYGPVSGNIRGKYPYEIRRLHEPFCEGNLEDSDIIGLCDLRKAALKSSNTSIIIAFKNNDDDGCFLSLIMPLVKNLNKRYKIQIKLTILQLIYYYQAPLQNY